MHYSLTLSVSPAVKTMCASAVPVLWLVSTVSAGVPAAGQGAAPAERCGFQGFTTTFPLAETVRATDGWVVCPPGRSGGSGCRTSPLKAGEPVAVYHAEGNWTCAALPGGPGWLRSADLRAIRVNPTPTLSAWLGTFNGGAGRVTIRRAKTPGALTLSGRGTSEGGFGVVHYGRFSGDATPSGNRMHFSDGYCEIDMALIGRYILADDNNRCGAMNVRFWGIWTRVPRTRRATRG